MRRKYSPILPGEKFGELTAIRFISGSRKNAAKWLCLCSCGNEARITAGTLRYDPPNSCGCINKRNYKHGMSGTPLFWVWHSMRQRCENPTDPNFHHYGGRGITVCDRWREFVNFHADMGIPGLNQSIDRVNNDGPYSPENCRWASQRQQMNNRRGLHLIDYKGEKRSIADWARVLGMRKATIYSRYRSGWPHDKLFLPTR